MRTLGTLWLIVFIGLMGFGITVLPFPLVAENMGASDFWKTFGGSGVFSLFQFLAAPLWGRCSDAFGRKPILIASMIGSVLAYVWLAYADTLVALILARAFGGIMSGNIAAAFAYATDVTEVGNRAKGLGVVTSAFGLGFAVGPLLGGYFGLGPDGMPSLYWPSLIAAVLSFVAFLGTWFLLPESLDPAHRKPFGASAKPALDVASPDGAAPAPAPAPRRSPFAAFSGRPVLLNLMLTALLVSLGGAIMQSVYPFWARDAFGYGVRDLGPQFFLLAIVSAAGQLLLTAPMVKRFGERYTVLISICGLAIGLIVLAVATHPIELWIGITLFGLALGLFTPSLSSLVSFESDPKSRGAVMGMYQAASSAGRILGPAIAGPLYFAVAHAAPYVLSAALSIAGGLLLARGARATLHR
jgi:MFS family permease